ncbi:MAG: SDR family NAD(P)-dependent oxidoreductase [Pseudomonadales bacterium]|nr:SDR family NAD(P)-dependent oxidoreductase [Halioglobus sp.]MCP5130881.1 SDR family NAD(P)-dependent oxidoreductase [Pseudomonadales bacterium]
MSQTVTLDETIVVQRPLHEVFAYVSEFSRIQEWDPGVASGHKLTPGAPAVGSKFRIDMKAGFSLYYTLIELEQDKRMLMTVDSRVFTAREEILFGESEAGTTVRYIANFDFPAPLAAANRLYPSAMDRVGKSTMLGLKEALQDEFEAPAPSSRLAMADRLVLPGLWRFTRLGFKKSRKHWKPVSAYLGDKHALVTGATSGVGEATATALAGLGARVTLVARDEGKAAASARKIREQTGNPNIAVELCDLSVMSEVHALADRLLAAGEVIDVLVNNAGALFNPRQQTSEGFEKSFALLLLSPFVLTERLQPLLAKSGSARVVNVSSGGMYTQKIHPDDLQSRQGAYSGSVAYARAKRGLMILTQEWAERWREDGIVVNAMHPGWADTPGVESSLSTFYRVTRRLLRSPQEGADTAVWLAAATEAGRISGRFWLDREQHPDHIFSRTRETPQERALLLSTLQELLASTREKPSAGQGSRRKA